MGKIKESLSKAWHGKEKLWVVFWIYSIAGGLILWMLLMLLALLFGLALGVSHADMDNPKMPFAFIYLELVPSTLYGIWLSVCTWRCAFNASIDLFGYLARGLVVLWVIQLFFTTIHLQDMEEKAPKQTADPSSWKTCDEAVAYYAKLNMESVAEYTKDHPTMAHDMAELNKCVETSSTPGGAQR